MHTLALATILAFSLPLTPALADGKVTWGNGATGEWTRDCDRSTGQVTCTADSTITGPGGKTASKTKVRTTTPGNSVVEVTLTGPNGETRTRSREVTWGN